MVRVVRATPIELATAVQALRDGELVAFPTETVYGLGAHAGYPAALRRIFEVKDRPTTPPLIVHIDSEQEHKVVFDATLSLARRELSPARLRRLLARSSVSCASCARLKGH